MKPLAKAEPLHVQAYTSIKEALLNGLMKPGERLVEVKLAERLGTSRGPVREAVRTLIHEGLLTQNENAVFVYHPTIEDIIELYECRGSLEALACRLSVAHLTTQDFRTLKRFVSESKLAFANQDRKKVVELSQQFHLHIIEASRNRHLIDLMRFIQSKVHYMRNAVIRQFMRDGTFIEEHERLVQVLESGNPDLAEKEMKQHIANDLASFCTVYMQGMSEKEMNKQSLLVERLTVG